MASFKILLLLFSLSFHGVFAAGDGNDDDDAPALNFQWTVSLSQLAPLGVHKAVIVINDQFPGPLLNVTTNDVVNINVFNSLPEPFLLTWNGLQMRKNSWQDGVQETNCPILPGQNWTYSFQIKDQIGSFFYYPSLLFQKAAGGYGPIRANNRAIVPVPFPTPAGEFDVLIGDWYNADHSDLRANLDEGMGMPDRADGILINGLGPLQAHFSVQPGGTYLFRISNVGLKTSLNFRVEGHVMLLVETEGSYTLQQSYKNLDIHVGQSYSVLITADRPLGTSYYMVATSRFLGDEIAGVATLQYGGSLADPVGPIPPGPNPWDYNYSLRQARSIRWNLQSGAARPNPQGSFHYGQINVTRTVVLENDAAMLDNQIRYTINGISFVHPETPMKLADYFRLDEMSTLTPVPDAPDGRQPQLGSSLVNAVYRDFIHFVLQNSQPTIQTWHIDGYSVFVVGMDGGIWNDTRRLSYNMFDAVSRSTVQVYPNSWTAVMVEMDNRGMWNMRSQDAERSYLGQELYLRVKGKGEEDPSTISPRDEAPLPPNYISCGAAPTAVVAPLN